MPKKTTSFFIIFLFNFFIVSCPSFYVCYSFKKETPMRASTSLVMLVNCLLSCCCEVLVRDINVCHPFITLAPAGTIIYFSLQWPLCVQLLPASHWHCRATLPPCWASKSITRTDSLYRLNSSCRLLSLFKDFSSFTTGTQFARPRYKITKEKNGRERRKLFLTHFWCLFKF